MPTNANDHPFRAPGKVSAEDLLRYARGEGDARERHRIEQHLLADPLLAEAAEGLQEPGAVRGWEQLRGSREAGSQWRAWAWSIAAVLVVGGVIWVALPEKNIKPASVVESARVEGDTAIAPIPSISEPVAVPEKISSAVRTVSIPLPEVFAGERSDADVVIVQRRPIEAPTNTRPAPAPLASSRKRSSRQLVFLHDLKLVHPDELYQDRPPTLFELGVPASAENAADTLRWTKEVREEVEPYLVFFDAVMAHIEEHKDNEALTELDVILDQYPNDVNALFYAGYSSYRTARYDRAIDFLHKAAGHEVDSFQEEAEWYEALALLEGRGIDDALPALKKVETERGFYSARASALIGLLNPTPSGSR